MLFSSKSRIELEPNIISNTLVCRGPASRCDNLAGDYEDVSYRDGLGVRDLLVGAGLRAVLFGDVENHFRGRRAVAGWPFVRERSCGNEIAGGQARRNSTRGNRRTATGGLQSSEVSGEGISRRHAFPRRVRRDASARQIRRPGQDRGETWISGIVMEDAGNGLRQRVGLPFPGPYDCGFRP